MEERFWSKVDKSGDCWVWKAKKSNGYGRYWKDNRHIIAHRYSWILANGQIPEGQIVRHKCRNKCVNPAHLELGTRKDNTDDRIRDGTEQKGETAPCSKLTDDTVRQIRRRANESQVELAKEFNVSPPTIWKIIHKLRWTHIV
jgi:hypothetical protein